MTAAALTRFRYLFLAAGLLMTGLLALALPDTAFDTRIDILLGDQDPYVAERNRVDGLFPTPQIINIAITPRAADTTVFDPAVLEVMGALHREYRRIPYAVRASSVLAYDSPFGEIGFIPGRMRNFGAIDDATLEQASNRAMANEFINGVLVSPDQRLALFTITLSPTETTFARSRDITRQVEQLTTELTQNYPDVLLYASAEALYETSTRDAMIEDLTRLLPLVVLCCILLVCYCFRSIRHGMTILLVTLLTVICTVGAIAWAGFAFNSVSVMAPLVVVIIAVANTAHILSVFRQQLEAGSDATQAMRQSLAFNLRPVSLAALTTGIGFASLNFASAPAISQFGSIVATGVAFAWLHSFFSFPALVLLTTARPGEVRLAEPLLKLCQFLVARFGRSIFYGTMAAGIVAAALLPLNKTDFNRLDFIDHDSSLHAYYRLISEHMQRGTGLSYAIRTSPDGALNPGFLQRVDSMSDWLRERDDVHDVVSLVEVVKTINQTLEGARSDDPDEFYRLPDSAEDTEQHLMNYLSVQRPGYSLNNFLTDDYSTIRLIVTTTPLSNQQIINLDQAFTSHFATVFADTRSELLHGSDTLLFARMDESVTRELIISYLISLAMITLALTVGLRSLYFGLISVIPNLLPATLVFGAWGLFVGRIDPFVMMLFSISIGLVVDDTVHMISTYQRQRQAGLDVDAAITSAVQKAGPALTVTTIVLALGTTILLFASTLYFQQAARLLVPIVVLALILDLTFLPLLLQRLEKLRSRYRAGY